jgi:hypothetical protein
MRWFRPRSHEYLDDHKISRRETCGGALFIFASVVVVLKTVSWQFHRVFFIAAAIGIVLFALTRHKLAYVAATTGWMAFRFVVGVVLYRESRALPWAIGLGAFTWFLLYIGAKREMDEYTRRQQWWSKRQDTSHGH